jgi:hypothetical protein
MFRLLLVTMLAALGAHTASAQSYGTANHAIYGGFGFTAGGFSLGIDYENMSKVDYGLGGYLRMYQKEDDSNVGQNSPGVTAVGAFIRPHFSKKAWDFYVSPGVAILSIDSNEPKAANNRDDATTLGPSLGIGLLYEMSSSVALGVENMKHWVWFEEDWRGIVGYIDDFQLRFRMSF